MARSASSVAKSGSRLFDSLTGRQLLSPFRQCGERVRPEGARISAERNGQWIALVRCAVGGADPDEPVDEQGFGAGGPRDLGRERQVELASAQGVAKNAGRARQQRDAGTLGKRLSKRPQRRRHVAGDEVVGDAEPYPSPSKAGAAMRRQVSSLSAMSFWACVEEPLTLAAQDQLPLPPVEHRLAEQLLQPADLLAHGRLREAQGARGMGDGSRFHDRGEGPQQSDIDIAHHVSRVLPFS